MADLNINAADALPLVVNDQGLYVVPVAVMDTCGIGSEEVSLGLVDLALPDLFGDGSFTDYSHSQPYPASYRIRPKNIW